jgi:N-methylhydantoinase A
MQPTVTDANLLLGRLRPDAFLGGRMSLDVDAAKAAVGELAQAMGLEVETAAEGIIRVANEHMARALRVISVQRGEDPRGYTLVSFGGAGGLHVCALAEALGMQEAMVPVHAGVLSALGMLATRPGRQLVRTHPGLLHELSDEVVELELKRLAEEGIDALEEEGIARSQIEVDYSLDLRYLGQSYSLNIPWHDCTQAISTFHQRHQARYGHQVDAPVELVNLRAALRGAELAISLPAATVQLKQPQVTAWTDLVGFGRQVPCYHRNDLGVGSEISGPALITEMASTTWLAPDWRLTMDSSGNLILSR